MSQATKRITAVGGASAIILRSHRPGTRPDEEGSRRRRGRASQRRQHLQMAGSDPFKVQCVCCNPHSHPLTPTKPNSPYSGGKFKYTLTYPDNFPFKAPTFQFNTKVYHPNFDKDGNICIGLLKAESWKPTTRVSQIFQAIRQLLAEPNPDDPLDAAIADVYKVGRCAVLQPRLHMLCRTNVTNSTPRLRTTTQSNCSIR
ncbi:hypothetical protein E3P99_02378 [Wallemia hederae]|uniref:UBC core domain-containing protein n=1 Tax=Wallemia hederae TaxID=1540922 RepID=A0A4V4LTB3_9BASI|nr:hypothetical protein E3P99_02378 [Wallemia hederae]